MKVFEFSHLLWLFGKLITGFHQGIGECMRKLRKNKKEDKNKEGKHASRGHITRVYYTLLVLLFVPILHK